MVHLRLEILQARQWIYVIYSNIEENYIEHRILFYLRILRT